MAHELVDLKDGDAIEPRHFNAIHAVLRQILRLSAAAPLSLSGWTASGGEAPTLALIAPVAGAIVLTTTEIPAASGGTYGEGEGVLLGDTGTTLASTATKVVVKNLTVKRILTGKRVLCLSALGSYWVVTPQACADLSA